MWEKGRSSHLILQLLQKYQAREIEKAVKTGKLSHLIKEIGQQGSIDRKPEGDRQKPPPEDRGRVEMVYKGENSKQEELSRKRKPSPLESWMTQSISF
ncbi:hypothetical protein L1987_03141 [Smallanthus sonchifolius]|uniref:Uncharacterized protein n=1 Tax=Smallanthus sonchifolius TaxID=185202 RepID=A0ACB9K9T2_9ASTR|nr:hypothetical protein L1987_03141 [Smallanthus sonchifolius]